MEQSERREEIKRLLFLRRYETISNLANELNVSTRTIRRDLEILCLDEAIYTVPGRYTGGVYVLDTFNPNFKRSCGNNCSKILLKIRLSTFLQG